MKRGRLGWILLALVASSYAALFLSGSPGVGRAFAESLSVLETVMPILLVVLALMALIESLVDPRAVARHLGEESGVKGWLLALVGGVLSHGPGYAWYPLLQSLREQGARDGLIVAFFYARAVKIPWLPMMGHYFGWRFTLVFSGMIVAGAWIQGVLFDLGTRRKGNDPKRANTNTKESSCV